MKTSLPTCLVLSHENKVKCTKKKKPKDWFTILPNETAFIYVIFLKIMKIELSLWTQISQSIKKKVGGGLRLGQKIKSLDSFGEGLGFNIGDSKSTH